jgi:K+ transporter
MRFPEAFGAGAVESDFDLHIQITLILLLVCFLVCSHSTLNISVCVQPVIMTLFTLMVTTL